MTLPSWAWGVSSLLLDTLPLSGVPPFHWRQQHIILVDNPSGDLTNSNLEQAGVLAHVDMAVSLYNLCELTLATLNENSAAITQNQKGGITLDHVAAYLCRLSSLHCQHHHHYHEVSHIQGKTNLGLKRSLTCLPLSSSSFANLGQVCPPPCY